MLEELNGNNQEIKYASDQQGFIGKTSHTNDLIYTFEFSTQTWNQLFQIPMETIEKFSCTTYFQKDGKRFLKISKTFSERN